jgi:hypothetical protein
MYCNLTYIAAGVGIGLCILVYVFQAIDILCFNAIKNILLCILASVYSGTGAILTKTSLNADKLGFPETQWRTAIWALFWVDLGLTLLMAGISNAFSERQIRRQLNREYASQPMTNNQPNISRNV